MRASQTLRHGVLALFVVLLASCGSGKDDTTPATVAPTPSATYASSVPATAVVTLDGSASTATSGGALTYSWVLSTVPTGSVATLANTTAAQATLTTDIAGTYVITLTVSDGFKSQAVALTLAANAYTPPTILSDLVEPVSGVVKLSLSADQGTSTVAWSADGTSLGSGPNVTWNTLPDGDGSHNVVAQIQSIGKYYTTVTRTFQTAQSPVNFTSANVTEGGGLVSAIVGVQSVNGILHVDATIDGVFVATLAAPNACVDPNNPTCIATAPTGYGFGILVPSGQHVVVVTATDGIGRTLGTQLRLTVTDVP